MKISSAEEYALRSVLYLARHDNEEKSYSLSQIADEENLPLPFMEQIFRQLRRQKLVQSRRGVSGGYTLSKPANQITVLSVIESVSGEITLQDCNSAYCNSHPGQCSVLPVWRKLENRIKETLNETTLDQLI